MASRSRSPNTVRMSASSRTPVDSSSISRPPCSSTSARRARAGQSPPGAVGDGEQRLGGVLGAVVELGREVRARDLQLDDPWRRRRTAPVPRGAARPPPPRRGGGTVRPARPVPAAAAGSAASGRRPCRAASRSRRSPSGSRSRSPCRTARALADADRRLAAAAVAGVQQPAQRLGVFLLALERRVRLVEQQRGPLGVDLARPAPRRSPGR